MTINKEIKRYYVYNFLLSTVDTGSGHFAMAYMYFHGFSIQAIVGTILTYGLTCLVILKPVGILLEKIGPQRTFRLHAVSEILKYASFISIFAFPAYRLLFFLLWQFWNGWNVMLNRIPLTAYFSAYGDNEKRGFQIGLARNIQILTGILVPIAAGALIERTGIILWSTVSTAVTLLAILVLRFDGRVAMKDPVDFKNLSSSVPKEFTQSLFFGKLAYPLVADLLSIYIAISLHSFTVLGIFVGIRAAVSVFLNYYVGRLTDSSAIRPLFVGSILASSIFWIIVPFVQEARSVVILQFTLGLAGLIIAIPFETAYHNVAKRSGMPLQFALWREVATQAGLVLGCVLVMALVRWGADWKALLPLGAFFGLAMLYTLPYMDKKVLHSASSSTPRSDV